jgi:hypothetical protein
VSYSGAELLAELRDTILEWTNHRVWNLSVELDSGAVVLRGFANSFHMKQLAQEGVRKKAPSLLVKNAITVLA